MHDKFATQNLASVQVLFETASGGKPTAGDCEKFRAKHGHEDVVTLYDPTGKSSVLWEQSYTSLNVFIGSDRVIRKKLHTDDTLLIQGQIQKLLDDAPAD